MHVPYNVSPGDTNVKQGLNHLRFCIKHHAWTKNEQMNIY